MRWARAWVGLASAALIGALALVWWHSGETTAATLAAGLAATGPLATWLPTRCDAATGTMDDRLDRLATVGGLPSALGMAAVHPWTGYQVAHFALAVRGRLPWRLFTLLEDAHRRGVLRQVGAVYQFRHARLHDRLARL